MNYNAKERINNNHNNNIKKQVKKIPFIQILFCKYNEILQTILSYLLNKF